jgi:hypothetical protein
LTFENYLSAKKIDSAIFQQKEPDLWQRWKEEFVQVHPKSFSAQKLYLINPIRRKYPLPQPVTPAVSTEAATPKEQKTNTPEKPVMKPAIPKPVFKPKPKTS